MEAKDRPVDFQRALDHIKAASPYPDEEPLDDVELQQAFNTIMETDSFKILGIDFQHELRLFFSSVNYMYNYFNVEFDVQDICRKPSKTHQESAGTFQHGRSIFTYSGKTP
jgi:hypothetical protein